MFDGWQEKAPDAHVIFPAGCCNKSGNVLCGALERMVTAKAEVEDPPDVFGDVLGHELRTILLERLRRRLETDIRHQIWHRTTTVLQRLVQTASCRLGRAPNMSGEPTNMSEACARLVV